MNNATSTLVPPMSLRDAMRAFGLSARALRFYEEKGLIRAGRDRLNYRFYDSTARKRLAWIASLRSVGVSLKDIRVVIAEEEVNGAGRACALRTLQGVREYLERELRQVDQLAETLRRPPEQQAPSWSQIGAVELSHRPSSSSKPPPLRSARRAIGG